MARPKSLKPSYCRHKTTGRAFVVLAGKFVYLGDHGTQASRDAYDRVIGEWIARGRRPTAPNAPGSTEVASAVTTVSHVIAAFWAHARTAYPHPATAEGKRPEGEAGNFFDVLKPLRRLYGKTPAAEFGPRALKALREEFIRLGWCRNVINRHVWRVKLVFKWAASEE